MLTARSREWRPRRVARRRLVVESLEARLVLAVSSTALPPVDVLFATTSDSQSVTATYNVTSAPAGGTIDLTLYRSTNPAIDSTSYQLGSETLSGGDATVGVHTVKVIVSGGLAIDPSHEYVVAGATTSDSSTPSFASFRTFVIGGVTHGFTFPIPDEGPPQWIYQMANTLSTVDHYDRAFAFDWSSYSGLPLPFETQLAGAQMTGQVVKEVFSLLPEMHAGDVIDLHLIGHSRGSPVISQVAQDLQKVESVLPQLADGFEKLTFLDPHPASPQPVNWYSVSSGPLGDVAVAGYNAFVAIAQDPPVIVPSNVAVAEVYYQHTDHSQAGNWEEQIMNLWGQVPVTGTPIDGPVQYCDLTGVPGANGHTEVHQWYQANVAGTLGTNHPMICPGSMTSFVPPLGAQVPLNVQLPRDVAIEPVALTNSGLVANTRIATQIQKQTAAIDSALQQGRFGLAGSRFARLQQFLVARQNRGVSPRLVNAFRTQSLALLTLLNRPQAQA